MKIQIDISEDISDKIAHYRIDKKISTKSEAIKIILEDYFKYKNKINELNDSSKLDFI